MREVVVASLLLLGLLASRGAADEAICAMSCIKDPNLEFVPGHTYQYLYEGEAVTSAQEALGQESTMKVKAQVTITARTSCDLKMKVSDITMDDAPDEKVAAFALAVEAYDLHFSFQAGEIEYLCPLGDEDVVATNFKRGILSALQVARQLDGSEEMAVKETDVWGECQTRYNFETTSKIVVTKTKEKCRSSSEFPFVPHSSHADYTAAADLPFARRTQSCRMERGDGVRVWEQVECTEEIHIEGPTSSLATMALKSSLVLQAGHDARSDTPEGFYDLDSPPMRRESLKMDLRTTSSLNEVDVDQVTATSEVKQSLDDLANTLSDSSLEEERPLAFAQLVSRVGLLDEESLTQLWAEYREMDNKR